MTTVLVVPGLRGSGPAHWQSWFERQIEGCVRVEQSNWDEPNLPRWAGSLRQELDRARGHVWIVAHSFGCLATAHVAQAYRERIAGAMLVAPADPDKFGLSEALPDEPLGFPSVVVASTNDPWVRVMRAAWLADRWGSRFVNIGAAGHINVDSGHGPWPDGLEIFNRLRRANGDFPLGPLDGDVRTPGELRRKRNDSRRGRFDWARYLGAA